MPIPLLALALLLAAPQDPGGPPPAEAPAEAAVADAPAEDATATDATGDDRADAPEGPDLLPEGIAARAGDLLVPFERLDDLLMIRHGRRAEGMDVLNRLLTTTVLREEAAAAGIAISSDRVAARMAELDARIRQAPGGEGGLARQLEVGDVDPDLFREMLGIQMAQEELTRRALGLPEGQLPTNGQQNTWLDQTMQERGTEAFLDPWPVDPGAVVAKAGDTEVTLGAFRERMRAELPRALIEQACTQLVLLVSLEQLTGTVDPAEWEAAVRKELDARRAKHASDPAKQGISYEALLEAQGLNLGIMARDPSVEVTAMTTVLARRRAAAAAPADTPAEATFTERVDAGLRAWYADEQELFDGVYGERLRLRVCLQRATETPNDLVPRSIEQSMTFFEKLMPSIPDEEGFVAIVGQLADDPAMKQSGGELGWFGKGDTRLPENLRLLAFEHWAATGAPGVAGPIQVSGGVAILWVGEHEPAPAWPDMAERVLREHQGRILAEATPTGGIRIYLDPPPRFAEEPAPPVDEGGGGGPEDEDAPAQEPAGAEAPAPAAGG